MSTTNRDNARKLTNPDNARKIYDYLNKRLNMYADHHMFFLHMQKEFIENMGKHMNEQQFWEMFDSLKKPKQ